VGMNSAHEQQKMGLNPTKHLKLC